MNTIRLARNVKGLLDGAQIRCIRSPLPAFQSNEAASPSNEHVSPFVYNRNPRNLERMRIAMKPRGYALDVHKKNYWHKLILERSSQHITAKIQHHTGKTVLSASTQEWAIKQHLCSTTDMNAANAVGQVLAQRCLEAGMLEVHCEYEASQSSAKVQSILDALTKGGIALQEPPRYFPHRHFKNSLEPKPWTVKEPCD